MLLNGPPSNVTLSKPKLPEVSLIQNSSFDSKTSPIYYCQVINEQGESVGKVDFQLNIKRKEIFIQSVVLEKGKGYGKSVYLYIQKNYPGFVLVSSDQMTHTSDKEQEDPDAIILWRSLVRDGYAEETDNGFRMKRM